MMSRKKYSKSRPDSSIVDDALDSMGAEDLREMVRDALAWLGDRAHARLTNELISRAARGEKGWTPSGPDDEDVAEVLTFAEAAQRVGYADPSEMDAYLQQGMSTFLSRDYQAASRIFRALLIPISEGEIDLGQDEMADEVLGVDVADCAAQYVVSTYMTIAPAERAGAVMAAIGDTDYVGNFWNPLQELERAAVEPLPDFEDFLQTWRALIQDAVAAEQSNGWGNDKDRWLREVVERLEGIDGLAAIARSTRRSEDLNAWCQALVDAGDWKTALAAYEEAAEIVIDKTYPEGSFLDGAALAAQELGRKDLPQRLERAWRMDPSLLRLRRWLGSSSNKAVLKKRSRTALEACPEKAHCQRALLHMLLGDSADAARLLAAAPGLGWSDREHPGHLLFQLFCRQLAGDNRGIVLDAWPLDDRCMELEELKLLTLDPDEPRLPNPTEEEIVTLAGIDKVDGKKERAALLRSMRTAAEKRLAGVTKNKRRRYYDHAAFLAAAYVTVDGSKTSKEWLAAIRDRYRRFPALKREFEEYGIGTP